MKDVTKRADGPSNQFGVKWRIFPGCVTIRGITADPVLGSCVINSDLRTRTSLQGSMLAIWGHGSLWSRKCGADRTGCD